MSGRATVALITVTYNSADVLKSHWTGVGLPADIEWIVVDNASTDGSADVARKLGARVLHLPRNVGFSAANNVGAAATHAEVFVFVNPDVSVVVDSIAALARRAAESHCIVAPQLVNADGSPQENGRTEPYFYRKIQHFFGSRGSSKSYEVIAPPGQLVETSWVIGAALAMSRTVFEMLSGWDSKFFVYYEDSDLGMRARSIGVRTYVDGDVRWNHAWARATRRSFSWFAWRLEIRSATRFYTRYPWLLTHPRIRSVLTRFAGRKGGSLPPAQAAS